MKLYLHQFLSRSGIFSSKKEIINAIKNSEIKIGNEIITNPLYNFNNKKNRVYYKSRALRILKENIYLLLNKPVGYLSSKLTANDVKLGKKSVFELINVDKKEKNALFCVGRLDEDTSGLLIITNDGILGSRIINPKSKIEKVYEVLLEKQIYKLDIEQIEKGITITLEENGKIEKYKTQSCKIELIDDKEVKITLTEGKKREVRRIFEAIGHRVVSLKRISIGKIKLEDLKIKPREYIFVNKEFLDSKV